MREYVCNGSGCASPHPPTNARTYLVPHHFVGLLQFVSGIAPVPREIVHEARLELVPELPRDVGAELLQIWWVQVTGTLNKEEGGKGAVRL